MEINYKATGKRRRTRVNALPQGVQVDNYDFRKRQTSTLVPPNFWVALHSAAQPVYNIEGHGHHVYQVGLLALLVHNADVCAVITNSRDKWSRLPKSLMDQMVLEAAKQGKGKKTIDSLSDPQFKEWKNGATVRLPP